MKYLLILLMFCGGCNVFPPAPHVGDCVWVDGYVYKVLSEGKYSLELLGNDGKRWSSKTKNFDVVDCFDRVFKESK